MSDQAVYRGLKRRAHDRRTVTTASWMLPMRRAMLPRGGYLHPCIRKATVLLRSLFFFAMKKDGMEQKDSGMFSGVFRASCLAWCCLLRSVIAAL